MEKKRVFYAHCMSLYGTPQEERDVCLLEELGYDVVNPSHRENLYNKHEMGASQILIGACHALAFRGLPGGAISAGVTEELVIADKMGLPIFELPTFSLRGSLTIDGTRQYLYDVGAR